MGKKKKQVAAGKFSAAAACKNVIQGEKRGLGRLRLKTCIKRGANVPVSCVGAAEEGASAGGGGLER